MKKIINQPEEILNQMLDGLSYAYSDLVERVPETDVIARKDRNEGKVGLVSGGGSGHEPSHAGFVGKGMLSAAVCGEVFTSPTPDQVLEGIKAADTGAGVMLIIKNYSGDVMNFEMAKDMAEMEGIEVETIIVDDDIAVEDSTFTAGRRGVAGTVLVHKILGAYADQGKSLAEVKAAADKLVPNIKTIGVALTGATVPAVGKPGFVLADDEIEYGVGIHGEPGYRKEKLQTSKDLAKELVEKLKSEFKWAKGDTYGVLVNGLGSTPLMEEFVFMNDVKALLEADEVNVEFKKVGDVMTAIDMAGLSLTMIKLEDNWKEQLNHPVTTIAW
ncbi:dihydroxyacetone kinase subunit DhaK [Vagococcus fluvialis]|jgi:dihydroxyacetone kinase-like protein|uniref:Dihydroxyacetone kinase subunit DhaK n=2 Tax=Vagococcus fluvialis TaxID=2738 RepID=A0A7X6DBB4_9ENTE|nr:dihydroxyacetone kinase subunit DhaK [Vagococcus fluvialis]MDR2279171.1 dihydroxyacetone kinase subunit DhaK [Vagococcus sp.]MBO0428744.1 dihydroxyacetone kinase subunit DhaK [Vagococcus fluvialis]MBO0486693.1 dihydroxyacetone kinase subunit DhaK [Vagococcus fluvialis]NKC68913.1 dihydroxyacetone kinase subunit DhaK [Vagococcus fluvialis]UDM71705.1 dihydroxyacetone kinase subunit DhaK [Vagococcus fluvialis]